MQISNDINSQISLGQLGGLGKAAKSIASGETGEVLNTFGQLLKDNMNQINSLQANADQAVQTYSVGGDIELHNVILAVDKADMALQLAMQIRNRLVGAYQEISRMQV